MYVVVDDVIVLISGVFFWRFKKKGKKKYAKLKRKKRLKLLTMELKSVYVQKNLFLIHIFSKLKISKTHVSCTFNFITRRFHFFDT